MAITNKPLESGKVKVGIKMDFKHALHITYGT
jgi:hypothetical protein